ncbi:oligoendopeptidase F [Clostridiisalibacter paucivorans]|uniref:oligoendopeptidase F n=1 Tax=Clostridiisalibacter paucivorans TaxID=408753 RepID=UPI0005585AE6|nr:oligoendopeptidase F [Clostridiisalibacter paucivorans]
MDRKDISEKYKWDLSFLYKDNQQWERDFERVKSLTNQIKQYKNKLGNDSETLLEVLNLQFTILRNIGNLYCFAKMKKDEDNNNSMYQGLTDRAEMLMTEVDMALSFIVPEILNISKDTMEDYLNLDQFSIYRHYLEQVMKKKPHILSASEESLLARTGEIANGPQNIYTMLNNADIKFPKVIDEEGNEVEITHGRFIPLMESKDRRVRKDTFKGLYDVYSQFKHTIASTLSTEVKKNVFYSRARKYNSSLEAALFQNDIPVKVYENLIETISSNLDPMHKYVSLRKEILGYEELHMYDLYTPIVEGIDLKIDYEEAKDTVVEALKPLGEDYINVVKKAFDSRWIDVYENKGKRSGAYSWGTYDSPPYILLNYHKTLDNMFTIAHEMGHSMHSYLSNKNQPYIYSGYSIFVAEVASTVNETLLTDYLLKNTDDIQIKKYILNHYLEQFRATVYRQTMFAEFEKIIHEKVEQGEPLTADNLSNIYKDLNIKYYGKDIFIDEEISVEWARIPHFYYNFYVYQYATGFSAAIALSQGIINGDKESRDAYIEFLSSGSSDYPINVLKKAGVDMTKKTPIEECVRLFNNSVDEMKNMMLTK